MDGYAETPHSGDISFHPSGFKPKAMLPSDIGGNILARYDEKLRHFIYVPKAYKTVE